MRSRFCILLFLGLPLLVPASARAQNPWSGILDPSRATDWFQAGIPGGIPNRTTVCQTVTPSGDTTGATDRANIQNAIMACAGKSQVVSLASGTYYVNGLYFGGCPASSYVTLRGAGPDKTILKFVGIVGCGSWADIDVVGAEGWLNNYPGQTTWTAGYAQSTTTITVGSTAGLSTTPGASGNVIILDQRDDDIGICPSSGGSGSCSGVAGATENGTTVTITTSLPHGFSVNDCVSVGGVTAAGYNGWWTVASVPTTTSFTYTAGCDGNTVSLASGLASSGGGDATKDNGGVISSINSGMYKTTGLTAGLIDEHGGIGRECPDTNAGKGGSAECATGEVSRRDQMEIKEITAINATTNQITITPAIVGTNWRASQNPGIWWTGNYAVGDGIEDMTLDFTNDNPGSVSTTGGILLHNTYHCWVKNVRTINGNRNHVWIYTSLQDEVVDSYFFGTKSGYTSSYGVEVFSGNSANLIQNNICQHVVACVMIGGDTGSVSAYNYAVDPGYYQPDWLMPMMSGNHDFSSHELFEGNDTAAFNVDDTHGTSNTVTAFRNRFRAQDTPLKTGGLRAVQVSSFNRAANFIGNILGTSTSSLTGTPTYQAAAVNGSGMVWDIGMQGEGYSVPNDPLVASSLLRWGNYDVVTGAVRWCGNSSDPGWTTTCSSTSEIPTTGIKFINSNPVPTSTSLPASFYLPGQPPWWKTFWGTPPWPAIGPDVTGGTAADGVGGYSYAIPAQLCYENTPVDPAYQQSFKVTAATVSSGTGGFQYGVTLTVGTNSLAANDTVTISGVSPTSYNGTYQLLSTTSTTITYGIESNPGTYVSSGAVTWPNILLFNAAKCYPAAYGLPNPVTVSATPH